MFSMRYYLAVFFRRFPWFLIVAGGIAGLAITVALTLPAAYVSSTRMIVESAQIPGDLATSTVRLSAREQLQIFETRLLTRANMLEVARKTQVLPDSGTMSPDQIVDAMRSRTTIRTSTGRDQATLMTMEFEAYSGRSAAAVLNEYLSLILQEDAEFRATRAGQTQQFFEQEVHRLSEELAQQNANILAFKNANAESLPESLDYRRGEQLRAQNLLVSLDQEIASLEQQKERLEQVFEATGRVDTPQAAALTPLEARRVALENELNAALSVFSESNPKVRLLRNQIEQVTQQINAGVETDLDEDQLEDGADPAQAMFQFQMNEIETRITDLTNQREQAEQQLIALTEAIDLTPANAVALSTLERDAENLRAQYNDAVARLATAATGERIETLSRGQRISVVEQPSAPSAPTKPNRVLIAGGGTAFGILAGLALITTMELMNSTARRPQDVVKRLGITPLATIPYVRTGRQKLARRLSLLAVILVIMIAIPVVIYTVHTYYLPLDLIADRVMDKLGIR